MTQPETSPSPSPGDFPKQTKKNITRKKFSKKKQRNHNDHEIQHPLEEDAMLPKGRWEWPLCDEEVGEESVVDEAADAVGSELELGRLLCDLTKDMDRADLGFGLEPEDGSLNFFEPRPLPLA